jgi:hypothetical protein
VSPARQQTEPAEVDSAPGPMKGLINDLFRALHAESDGSTAVGAPSMDCDTTRVYDPNGNMASLLDDISLNDVMVDGDAVTISTDLDIGAVCGDGDSTAVSIEDELGGCGGDPMKSLIGDLFRALHAEAAASSGSDAVGQESPLVDKK